MSDLKSLDLSFEGERGRLTQLAQRMLGSAAEAQDVVQDAWIKLQRGTPAEIGSLPAWLTTVVSRLALDRLRARTRHREDPIDATTEVATQRLVSDPEQDVILADSVGVALLVVLDRLRPRERVAFVLYDLFALPFAAVGEVLGCTPDAARQLASRARRTVQGGGERRADRHDARKADLVRAFYSASRAGDLAGLISLLDPEVRLTADGDAQGRQQTLGQGATEVANRARLGAQRQQAAQVVLADSDPAIAVMKGGRLQMVMVFEVSVDRISAIRIVSDTGHLARLSLATPPPPSG